MRESALPAIAALIIGGMAPVGVVAQNGQLDTTFGDGGIVLIPFASGNNDLRSIDVQPDGRIVACGRVGSAPPSSVILRLLPDGSLDSSFAGDGILIGPAAYDNEANEIRAMADGKLLVAGRSGSDMVLERYMSNGEPDSAFGTNGATITDFGSGSSVAFDLDIGLFGYITTGGSAVYGITDNYMTIANHDPDGYPLSDANFMVLGLDATAATLAIQPTNGRAVMGGNADSDMAVARVYTGGGPDATFSGDGFLVDDLGGTWSIAREIKIDPLGRIVVCGHREVTPYSAWFLYRLLSDGTPDPSFGVNGLVSFAPGTGDRYAYDMDLLPDGRIAVGGFAPDGAPGRRFAIALFEPNGALVNSFGTNGLTTTPILSTCEARALAVQADGRLLLAGYANGSGQYALAIARYEYDFTTGIPSSDDGVVLRIHPDPLTSSGRLTFSLPASSLVRCTLHDPEGRILQRVLEGTVLPAGVNGIDFRTADLPAGCYILRLTHGGGSAQVKFIKQ